jgi:hypothetical protein
MVDLAVATPTIVSSVSFEAEGAEEILIGAEADIVNNFFVLVSQTIAEL